MSATLTIGKKGRRPFTLPAAEAATQRFAILAKTGKGKTYLLRVMAEEMIAAGIPLVILDAVGVCWGLRSSANGKGDGLPVVIFGGDHGDLPLEAESGQVIADWVIAERRPVVLDLSALPSKAAERRFVTAFAQRLYRKNRAPIHLMIDEADQFAPQQPQQGDQAMLGAINTLARRGRARGIGLTLATQRSAVLNKNVLTQSEVLVAMGMTAPQDVRAIEEWIKYHGDKNDRDKVLGSLGKLPVGTAWFWSPGWLDGLSRVEVRRCRTYDSSATPKLGAPVVRPKLSAVDLGELSDRIQQTVERAKEDDPAALRKRIAELERAEHPTKVERVEVEVPVVHALAHDRAVDLRLGAQELAEMAKNLIVRAERMEQILGQAPTKGSLKSGNGAAYAPGFGPPHPDTLPGVMFVDPSPIDHPKLTAGLQKILTAVAQHGHGGVSREQLSVLTAYKKSSRDTYLQRLRAERLVERNGDTIVATQAGIAALGPAFQPLPTGVDLQRYWLDRLPAGESKLLRILVDKYPAPVGREALSHMTGYKKSSRDNYLQRLRARKLVDVESGGRVCATEMLFDQERR